MQRRQFLGILGGVAVAWPLVSRAQQVGKVYRIGILETIAAAQNAANLDALRKGLRNLGYVEGQNLVIEYRSAEGRAEQFPKLLGTTFRRPIFDDQVLPFDVAEVPQSLAQRVEIGGVLCRSYRLQNPDAIDLPHLLRARYERPRDCHAAENAEKLPPLHVRPQTQETAS